MFKKFTQKIVRGVKDSVVEEASKTTEEIKEDVKTTMRDAMPYIIGGLIVTAIALIVFKRPVPVVVKVVVKTL